MRGEGAHVTREVSMPSSEIWMGYFLKKVWRHMRDCRRNFCQYDLLRNGSASMMAKMETDLRLDASCYILEYTCMSLSGSDAT